MRACCLETLCCLLSCVRVLEGKRPPLTHNKARATSRMARTRSESHFLLLFVGKRTGIVRAVFSLFSSLKTKRKDSRNCATRRRRGKKNKRDNKGWSWVWSLDMAMTSTSSQSTPPISSLFVSAPFRYRLQTVYMLLFAFVGTRLLLAAAEKMFRERERKARPPAGSFE